MWKPIINIEDQIKEKAEPKSEEIKTKDNTDKNDTEIKIL